MYWFANTPTSSRGPGRDFITCVSSLTELVGVSSEWGGCIFSNCGRGKGSRPSSSPGKPSASLRTSLSPPPPPPPKKHAHESYWNSWIQFSGFFCFVFKFSFVYCNFFSFLPAYFLYRNSLWKPLQKMPTVVLNKGRGKLFRGEIWVKCHCGILDLEADKGGLGWARRGFPLRQSRWRHYRMRGAPSLFL